MIDETERYRRERQAEINSQAAERAALEKQYGEVLDTKQIRERYEVLGFMAPYVVVKDKATGKRGSMEFQHMPRFYFGFVED
jgi:hypothetical protein